MKGFFILCLMALASTASWGLNERATSIPSNVQKQRAKRVFLVPRTGRRDIQRFFYLKHLLELNCLRHICNNSSCKGGRCPASSRSDDRKQHDQVYYNRIIPPMYRRRYPSDDRMIVVPPNLYIINPRVESLSQLSATGKNPQGGNLLNQNSENVIYIQFPPQSEEPRTADDQFVGDELGYPDSEDIQKSNHDSKSRTTTSHSLWQEPQPNRLPQYEVEETVDEDPIPEGTPFFLTKKPAEETVGEELSPEVMKNNTNRNNINKETVKKFSNHRSRVLVDEKPPQEVTKHSRIPFNNRGQKTPTAEPNTSSTTISPGKKSKTDYISALPSEQLESVEHFTDEPATDRSAQQQETRKPSSVTFSEFQTTAKVISRDFITPSTKRDEDGWSFPEEANTSVNMIKTVRYFSEATVNKPGVTTPDFQEFTDHPLLFDLFPKTKPKDAETVGKNSRKMHFGDPPKKYNQDEQRRSDILINENDDYDDYETAFSGSNYLEKLRENSSTLSVDPPRNLSGDAIIPLIPIVINDLREGKIAQDALPVLSEMFGKYWPTVVALSNTTDVDMLPLLKMKDEKDLENVLRSFFPENFEQTTTTEKTETELSKNLYYDLYDYDVDNYRDLYKDFTEIQDEGLTDKKKRFENDSVQ